MLIILLDCSIKQVQTSLDPAGGKIVLGITLQFRLDSKNTRLIHRERTVCLYFLSFLLTRATWISDIKDHGTVGMAYKTIQKDRVQRGKGRKCFKCTFLKSIFHLYLRKQYLENGLKTTNISIKTF